MNSTACEITQPGCQLTCDDIAAHDEAPVAAAAALRVGRRRSVGGGRGGGDGAFGGVSLPRPVDQRKDEISSENLKSLTFLQNDISIPSLTLLANYVLCDEAHHICKGKC